MCALKERAHGWALEHVWVDPASIGKGLGRFVVEHALAIARDARSGPVQAQADPHAAAFYERLGAKLVGTVPVPMPGAPNRVLSVFEFDLRDAANS